MHEHVRSTREAGKRDKRQTAAATRDLEVQVFLDRLAESLTQGDAHTVATMWQTPAFVVGDAEEHLVQAREQVEQFFSGAKQQYNSRGVTNTRADIQCLDWLTDRVALVEVRWPYLDASNSEVGEETSTYLLKRDDSGELKLRIAVMHGEATQKTH
jgi:hypothetical protein